MIERGEISAGERLPTESALAAKFSVNRLTVRQALGELGRAGVVVTRWGVGTFAAEPTAPLEGALQLFDWSAVGSGVEQPTAGLGVSAVEVVLDIERREPEAEIAEQVGSEPLTWIETVHRFDNRALMRSEYWVRTDWEPDRIEALHTSGDAFSPTILKDLVGGPFQHRWRAFESIAATRRDAEVLGIPAGAPLLRRSGLDDTPEGVPVIAAQRNVFGGRVYVMEGMAEDGGQKVTAQLRPR